MADGDGRVVMQQQQGHGLSNDVAAPDDDCASSLERNLVAQQDFDDPCRSARDHAGPAAHELADVQGMEPVHVLRRVHSHEDPLRVHARRERKLHQDAVNVVSPVEFFDQCQELVGGRLSREVELLAVETQRLAGFHFVADVNLRGGIGAHQDGDKPRRNARTLEFADLACELRQDLIADLVSVQNARRHKRPPARGEPSLAQTKYRHRDSPCRRPARRLEASNLSIIMARTP